MQDLEDSRDSSPLLTSTKNKTGTVLSGYQTHENSGKSTTASSKSIADGSSDTEDTSNNHILSTRRQMFLMITLLSLYACLSCTSSLLYPFFGPTAKEKGISDFKIGVVYSAYEITRFIGAPIYGTMVSVTYTLFWATIFNALCISCMQSQHNR